MDLFIGLSGARVMPAEALSQMRPDAMVFAMANPTPEVSPEEAAAVRAHHRDRPLGLPQPDQQRARVPGHLPRRTRRPRAAQITEPMKMAAARAIATIVAEHELREDYIIPSVFNRDVAPAVAEAVSEEARVTGAAPAEQHAIGFAPGDVEALRGI